jgi:hypothetical protein
MRKPKEYKAFEDLVKKVLAVPKEEIDRRDAEWKKSRKKVKGGSKVNPSGFSGKLSLGDQTPARRH